MDGTQDWSSILLAIIILSSFILNFTDVPQRMQFWRFSSIVRRRIYELNELENDGRRKSIKYLKDLNVPNPKELIENYVNNFFMISPVDIEPTDIISRLRHLLRTRDEAVKKYVIENLRSISDEVRQKVEVVLELNSILTFINKVVKHYYNLGVKYNDWVLMMRLALDVNQIYLLAKAYNSAIEAFSVGAPVGDGAGPLAVRTLINSYEEREIASETVVYESSFENRRVYVIKAKGPGPTVGRPGEALEKLVNELGGKVARIITVDAALKLESERSGEVAFGVGAAIGDIGPEKIAIERIATKYAIPLDAVVVKMSHEEAINTMTKEIYDGVLKAVDVIKNIIKSKTKEGDTIVIVGVGNTLGIK